MLKPILDEIELINRYSDRLSPLFTMAGYKMRSLSASFPCSLQFLIATVISPVMSNSVTQRLERCRLLRWKKKK